MKPYTVIRNVLEPQCLKLIETALRMQADLRYLRNGVDMNDTSAFSDGFPVGSHACALAVPLVIESLFSILTPIVEKQVGFALTPTYSFSRVYYQGASMIKHRDRPSCEISASLSVSIDREPWPIYFEGEEILLHPGDMVIYKGCKVEHWRNEYQGQEQIQAFMHWIKKGGENDYCAFDGRPMLGWGTWNSF